MAAREYGMFTEAGDEAVEVIVSVVEAALSAGVSVSGDWLQEALWTLSRDPRFAEAGDTMVRELAYRAAYGEEVPA